MAALLIERVGHRFACGVRICLTESATLVFLRQPASYVLHVNLPSLGSDILSPRDAAKGGAAGLDPTTLRSLDLSLFPSLPRCLEQYNAELMTSGPNKTSMCDLCFHTL
jgi:hypothetical protein